MSMPSISTSSGSPRKGSRTSGSTPSGPEISRSTGIRSPARRASGPRTDIRIASPSEIGKWPVIGTSPVEGLWPKTPLKKAGSLIEPAKSVPIPVADPAVDVVGLGAGLVEALDDDGVEPAPLERLDVTVDDLAGAHLALADRPRQIERGALGELASPNRHGHNHLRAPSAPLHAS